ncbi:LysR family transcriptional regulator ArgP [Desulfovibrio sp. X2]|uniref:LysR family transcriptional regulator ArgP n=1 Tax=Desulfovibrio sp. X2 TaxID=941449 RepID=UPI000557E1EC|nr:LysR family transcriptional regulator ArgP [Desulfovibrio sp. X2]
MIDYRCLEALAVVVEEGGFEKGARVLHLTQSAVSQRIRALEEGLGQVLLVRSSPPAPTATGRRLLAHWRQVRRLEEDVLAEAMPGGGELDGGRAFTTLPVGVNADSLATWFLPALDGFVREHRVLLDLRVDDQEATHEFLRDGEVVGCVSVRPEAMQGCRVVPLGSMGYRLVAAPDYRDWWCPDGLTPEAAAQLPLVIFNRKDDLHNKLLRQVLGGEPPPLRAHWLPSSEGFVTFIRQGHAAGMLPDAQSFPYLDAAAGAGEGHGSLVDLAPGCTVQVDLFWHCWNLRSPLLDELGEALVRGARELLS